MKIFELVVTETFTFRFSLPLPDKETLLSYTENEENCIHFFKKPNTGTIAPN